MAKIGLNRIPFYPQLNAISDNKVSAKSLCLSVLLYWTARDATSLFSLSEHTYQLALHTGQDLDTVFEALDELQKLDILDVIVMTKKEVKILRKGPKATITENDEKKTLTFLKVNFKKLSNLLLQKGVDISPKLLRHAADDTFDFYDVIAPNMLPFSQSILGSLKGDDFERACLICAEVACKCVLKDDYFSYKALAPGWRMLLQPPAVATDIITRWITDEQRAIDLGFSDGYFFMTDGDAYGTLFHIINHRSNYPEAKILACACLLGIKSVSDEISFISDIEIEPFKEAMRVLYDATGIIAHVDENFYTYKDIDDKKKDEFKKAIEGMQQELRARQDMAKS